MNWLNRLFYGRERQKLEFEEEVRGHLKMAAQDRIESGQSTVEANYDARREFGNVSIVTETARDAWGGRWWEELLEDTRYGLRRMRKAPGFSAIAILTLALGIGANTAIFSLVNGILLSSLPYPEPDRLVTLNGTYPKGAFVAMRQQMRTMDAGAYVESQRFNLTGQGEAVQLTGSSVSAELFSILGARPELGRTFYPGEDVPGQDNFVVLSHALWEQRFGADPGILGRSIELAGASRQVVGVMPVNFRFPSSKTELWVPLRNDPRDTVSFWAGDFMPIVGRLRPGVTIEQAQTEIRMFQSHVGTLFPWPMPATWNQSVSVVPLQNGMVADVRTRLLILLGAVALVLLIACSNVANLTLSRAATREKEINIRTALGAGRKRIARQLLTESVLQALVGGLLGLALAREGVSLLKTVLPSDTPRLDEVQMDWRVLAFTAALAIVTGVVFGLAPALHSARATLADSLNSGGRGTAASISQRLRNAFAIAQVALAVLLVIGAGLMIRSFWTLSHVNPGFRSEQVMTARISPNDSYCSDAKRCLTFYQSVLEQVKAFPGVNGAALINTLPLDGRVGKRSLEVENHEARQGEDFPLFWLNVVTPDYFRVMGMPVRSGRALTDADVSSAPVAIVTEETARRYWPNQNAVGKHIRLLGDKDWRTIVGVIPDVHAYDLQRNLPEWIDGTAYIPYDASATLEDRRIPTEMTIAIRTASDESSIGLMLRRTVAALNQEAPVSEVKSMSVVVSEAVSAPAATTALLGTFAALSLILGTIGIYGVLSFLVSNRTREIGVRMALGAQRRDVLWSVMSEGAKLALAGIAIGTGGAFAVMRVLSGQLYGVGTADPLTFAGVAGLVAIVALLACYIPAYRATCVDPVVVMRYE